MRKVTLALSGWAAILVACSSSSGAPAATPDSAAEPTPDSAVGPGTTADTGPVAKTTLFSDGFDSGFEINWSITDATFGPVTNALDGSNAIATLDANGTKDSRLTTNSDGSRFKDTSLTVSARVRVERAPVATKTIRLNLRQAAATENKFYAVVLTINLSGAISKVSLMKKVDDGLGNYTICSLAETPLGTPIAMSTWRTVSLTISGTTSVSLSASLEGAPMATFTDDCTSPLIPTGGGTAPNGGCFSDQTGLAVQVEKGIMASVDDILVTTP